VIGAEADDLGGAASSFLCGNKRPVNRHGGRTLVEGRRAKRPEVGERQLVKRPAADNCAVLFATWLLRVLAAVLALGAAFFLLLEWSKLEAERLNLGTLLGGDPDPKIELWIVGIILAVSACVAAMAARALRRSKR
jgi:hypothetical protein